jgi:hypothetical protein
MGFVREFCEPVAFVQTGTRRLTLASPGKSCARTKVSIFCIERQANESIRDLCLLVLQIIPYSYIEELFNFVGYLVPTQNICNDLLMEF